MPFTVAHAAVAPLLARASGGRLAVSALAVGAMSPDFEYLVFLDTRRTISHTPLGLVVLCLPLSIAALVLWHAVVKRPLAGLAPRRWAHVGAALARPARPSSWPEAGLVAVAALAGAISHVAWDSFTHAGSGAVSAIPALRDVAVAGLPLYKFLQYASGAGGLAVLGVSALVWAGRQPRIPVDPPPLRRRIVGATAITAITGAGAAANMARLAAAGGHPQPKHFLVAGVIGAMAGAVVAVTGYGLSQSTRGAAEQASFASGHRP